MSQVERLQAFLRAVAEPGRSVGSVSGFTLFLDRADPLRFFNYAIPDRDIDPVPIDIDHLRERFLSHTRLARLEWIEEAAPRVASALAVAGMVEELRTPLMACDPAQLKDPVTDIQQLSVGIAGGADIREAVNLQRVAFGQPPLEETAEMREGRTVLAYADGVPLAAASWTQIIDGVCEIAGVATAQPWRGRGLAGVLTAAAARAAFSAGATLCVLSPGNETAQRVYARAGFFPVATMLHWSDPD